MSEHVHRPGDPRIFVFGSNLDGNHAGGAAAYAARHCGAELGIGQGLVGGSYALPTCSKAGVPLTLCFQERPGDPKPGAPATWACTVTCEPTYEGC